MKNKYTFLSSFWIKILAFVFMTCDHVGFALESFLGLVSVALPLRIIGRLALPLFAFMIAEGATHSKNLPKYILRLGIMASIIAIGFVVIEQFGFSMRGTGNIFMDLTLGAVAIFCLKNKNKYIKLLSILPITVSILSFVASTLDVSGLYGHILWYPYFLRCQYDWYSVLLVVGFYGCYLLKDVILKKQTAITGLYYENVKGSELDRLLTNILCFGLIATLTIILHLFGSYILNEIYVYWLAGVQNWAILSGALILLYNGKRGYNSKWFQYGCYLYYPLHMIIIYLIFML